MNMYRNNQKGFTLIELIVTLAILGISLLIAVPNYMAVQNKSELRADLSTIGMIEKSEAHYIVLHQTHSFDESAEQTADNFQDSLNNLKDLIDPVDFNVITNVHWTKEDNRWHIVYDTTQQSEDGQTSEEEDEDDELPDHPQWDSTQDHYNTGDRVIYQGRVFEALHWTNQTPGILDGGWIEITDEWRDFNVYQTGDIVTYNGAQFKARWTMYPHVGSPNPRPGELDAPWDEITNEWRNFNVYNGGDTVEYMGHTYRARWYNHNEKPGIASVWTLVN